MELKSRYRTNLIRAIERHPRVLDITCPGPSWEIGRYKMVMPDGREAVFRLSEEMVTSQGKNPELLQECFGEFLIREERGRNGGKETKESQPQGDF